MNPTITFLAICLVVAHVRAAPTEDSAPTTPMTSTSAGADSTAPGANMVSAHAHLANTTFTCYSRQVGYYADPEADCKVYHFCMLGEYNGQEVYQRVSYMCLNETVFDQQALDCLEPAKTGTPCKESPKHYDESNAVLRKALIGKPESDELKKNENNASGQEAPKDKVEATSEKPDDKKTDEKKPEDDKSEDKKPESS